MAEGAIEIYRPHYLSSARWHVGNDEGRVLQVKFQIQGVILICRYHKRRVKGYVQRDSQVAGASGGTLNLYVIGLHGSSGGAGEAWVRVR